MFCFTNEFKFFKILMRMTKFPFNRWRRNEIRKTTSNTALVQQDKEQEKHCIWSAFGRVGILIERQEMKSDFLLLEAWRTYFCLATFLFVYFAPSSEDFCQRLQNDFWLDNVFQSHGVKMIQTSYKINQICYQKLAKSICVGTCSRRSFSNCSAQISLLHIH